MKLETLLTHCQTADPAITLINPEALPAVAKNEVANITSDSRTVKAGTIFVALSGSHTDGHQYVEKAIESGALAVVIQSDHQNKLNLSTATCPILTAPNTYKALAELCSQFHGEPGKHLKLVGVTGTNGKTTVTHLVETMLQHWGKSVGLIGTLGQKVSKSQKTSANSDPSHYDSTGHTTPMAPELQEILADMREQQQEYVVMEVSSHALDQYRVHGCDFQVAVLTNLTQDHLDYHKTMEHYWRSKALLFKRLNPATGRKTAVINLDTDHAEDFIKSCPPGVTLYSYSLDNTTAAVYAKNTSYSISGASFTVVTPVGEHPVKLKIAGQFSVYNALAAIAAGIGCGIPLPTCIEAIEQVPGIRGRFEVVSENPFVIVDYAHTPDGLKNILSAARVVTPQGGRLICVFGCGGDRDATKRPKMGGIVEELADVLVVTSDNPRSEDPQQIITDIMTGIKRFDGQRMMVNADREQAIHQAIDVASANDIIVVAGKGHEDYQILADKTIHFDDREVVQTYIANRSKKTAVMGS